MRLLSTQCDGGLFLTRDLDRGDTPKYAILSHTWGIDDEEVSFEDLKACYKTRRGYSKIECFLKQAAKDHLQYLWVDTCCIQKSNHTELNEAITSMFRWYRDATKCYVYLVDVSAVNDVVGQESQPAWEEEFRACRWFKRGWTLQELIAPVSVEFFSKEGIRLGDKRALERQISEVTGIAIRALRGAPLESFRVDERLSWTHNRETRREEDQVYSLMGIFDIYMPLIYGEGKKNAFRRLRKEMSTTMTDTSSEMSSKEVARRHCSDVQNQKAVAKDCIRNAERRSVAARFTTSGYRAVTVARHSMTSACPPFCCCICHKSYRLAFPRVAVPVAGFLSLAVLGLHLGCPPCNETTCEKETILRAEIVYRFPSWSIDRVLHFLFTTIPGVGLTASLNVIKVVADDAEIMNQVKAGCVEGVKSLFRRRLASPNDVNASCDVPILNYAVQGQHPDLCRFLVLQGANPNLENRLSISALDRAWDAFLVKTLSPEVESEFREIFSLYYDSPWFEEQQFQPLHKIILGVRDISLVSMLDLTTSGINTPDVKGRTPLAWAAARGDKESLLTPLEYGATPNLACATGNTPLLRAVRAHSPVCIAPLLRHGASIEWRSRLGFSALHYAAYYRDREEFVIPLLDAGAEIDAKDQYGWTPLSCTAERDNENIAGALIERGADLNSRDEDGWSPFLRSVSRNSHSILRLLLHWQADYSVVSQKGETVLHVAAAWADVETLSILSEVSYPVPDVDARNKDSLTGADILAARVFTSDDAAAKTKAAFMQLCVQWQGRIHRPKNDEGNEQPC